MKEVATKRFIAGINSDINPKFAQEGQYKFALNSVLETELGEYPSISNEVGNSIVASLPVGLEPIGFCLTNSDDIIVFSSQDDVISEIGKFNPSSNVYTTYIRSSCLNFSTKYPVSCLYSIKRGCEEVIYFTDRVNKYRSINLDALEDYTNQPTIQNANANDDWNCDEFNLMPNYLIPKIDLDSVNDTGGQLKVGTYQFAIQYIDNSGNPSEWFFVTNPIPVLSGLQNGTYSLLTGARPVLDVAEPEDGSVPTTPKSISITVSNLDSNYPYYRLAALHSTATIGKVSEVWYLEPQAIVSDEQTFTYTGPNTSVDVPGSLSDIIIENAPIHVAKAHAQVGQALWLANLENTKYNYAAFQRAASQITAAPEVKSVQVTNILNEGDPKNPHTWWKYRGFMPDEVYAFGIQYLFKDGAWSPVFHIPGRAATPAELALESASNNSSHLGAGDFPLWRVTNTGSSTTFAYHETLETTYPDLSDCNGESIWGVDSGGLPLAQTPIRHHRFPDRTVIPVYDESTDSINILGATFDNITYPHADIVGHRIVMAERTEENKTVLDNGFIINADTSSDESEFFGYRGLFGNPHQTMVYLSPKTLFENRYLNMNHLRCTHIIEPSSEDTNIFNVEQTGAAAPMYLDIFTYGNGTYTTGTSNENIEVDQLSYVAPRTSQTAFGAFTNTLTNRSFSNQAFFFHYPNTVNSEPTLSGTGSKGRMVGATAKRSIDPYKSLSQLIYFPVQTNYSEDEDSVTAFSGDSFVSNLNLFDIHQVLYASEVALQQANADYFSGIWLDSEINAAIRFGGTQRCSSIYQGQGINNYFRDRIFDPDTESEDYVARAPEDICEEYYGFNKDYFKTQIEKPGIALSYSFDYCSECLNSYPYRIRASEISYQEDSKDNYRVFRDSDRTDIPGVSGPITSLQVYNDNLYAIASRDIYFIPINQQTIQTSESLVYLGTGQRLSIPPRRLSSAQYPYGGSVHAFGSMVSEFGMLYIDYLSKKIFLMQGQEGLKDISSNGMRMFFQNNIPFELDKQFKQIYGIPYPYLDNPTYEFGLGFTVAYDPYHRRFIISKKDYRIKPEVRYLFERGGRESIDWISDKFVLNNNTTQTGQIIHFDDARYFENRSWTISYSVIHDAWASFHSYLPTLLYNDSYNLYSVNATNNIYQHNLGDYQTYYGKKYDHILDFTASSNPTLASVYTVFDVNCNATLDSDTDDYFFDRAIIYNSYQATGLQDIIIRQNAYTNTLSNNLVAVRAERNWRFNDFRDLVVDYSSPLFTNNWDSISADYFIDKIITPGITSTNKSQFEQSRFRDHYIGCRLYFNPEENVKLTTDIVATINKISYR